MPEVEKWRSITAINQSVVGGVFENSEHAEVVSEAIIKLISEVQTWFARAEHGANNTNSSKVDLLPICPSSIEERQEDYLYVHLCILEKLESLTLDDVNKAKPREQSINYVSKGYVRVNIRMILKANSGFDQKGKSTATQTPDRPFTISSRRMNALVSQCHTAINCLVSNVSRKESCQIRSKWLNESQLTQLQQFVNLTAEDIQRGKFNPTVYHVPREQTRLFTPLPLSGFSPGVLSLDTRAMFGFVKIVHDYYRKNPHELEQSSNSENAAVRRIDELFRTHGTDRRTYEQSIEIKSKFWTAVLPVLDRTFKFEDGKTNFGEETKIVPDVKQKLKQKPQATDPNLLTNSDHVICVDHGRDLNALVLTKEYVQNGIFTNSNHLKYGINLVKRQSQKQDSEKGQPPKIQSHKTNHQPKTSGPPPTSKRKQQEQRNKNPSGGMFDYAARVKESPVRDGIEYNFCLKASQYRDESRQPAADQKAAEIKYRFDEKAKKTVDELYNSIDSGKCIDPTKYANKHVASKLKVFEKLLTFELQRAHLKFYRYQGQQRAVQLMTNRFIGPYDPKRILIVLGGACMVSGPFKKVIRKLEFEMGVKIVRVDEFLTSQICAHCMSTQRQCTHKITGIDCRPPDLNQQARVKGLTEFSIDSVVDCTTGILSLSLMDIHLRRFSDRILFQTNDFSKSAPQEGPVNATEQWREEDLLVEAIFREGDESVLVDQDQDEGSNEVNVGTVEVNCSNEGNSGTAEMNGGAVEVNGEKGGGKEKVNVKEGNASKRLTMGNREGDQSGVSFQSLPSENVSVQWPSPYHSKWERVSSVPLEGALRVKLNSIDGNGLHKELEKNIASKRLGWKVEQPVVERVSAAFGKTGYVKGLRWNVQNIWAVKRCSQCNMTWNRDVLAARNIAIIFTFLNKNDGLRPPPFQREIKPNSKLKQKSLRK
ncbi:hypothetical protein HDU76_006401, partial [Blyttiomyces sp. JEL0837]